MSARSGALALAVLPLALLTGCGGGDEGLSKSEYVSQAEALCEKANKAIEDQPQPTKLEELGPSLQETLRIADDYTTQLEDLKPPKDDAAKIDKIFLGPLRAQVTALKDYIPDIEAAAAKGPEAVDALPDPDVPKADLDAMKGYGFKDCVETAEDSQ